MNGSMHCAKPDPLVNNKYDSNNAHVYTAVGCVSLRFLGSARVLPCSCSALLSWITIKVSERFIVSLNYSTAEVTLACTSSIIISYGEWISTSSTSHANNPFNDPKGCVQTSILPKVYPCTRRCNDDIKYSWCNLLLIAVFDF